MPVWNLRIHTELKVPLDLLCVGLLFASAVVGLMVT